MPLYKYFLTNELEVFGKGEQLEIDHSGKALQFAWRYLVPIIYIVYIYRVKPTLALARTRE